MNRFTLSAALAAILCLPAMAGAQSASPRVGVMGGLNIATLGGDDAEDVKIRTGLLAGVSYVANLSGPWAIEMDGLFSMKGAKGNDEGTSIALKLNYIEVPLLLRYNMASSGNATPHLAAGVSLAYQASCNVEGTDSGVTVSFDCDEFSEESGSEFKSFDAGVVVGGGIDFKSGTRTFTIGARYTFGLMDVADDAKLQNRAFQLYAGVAIPLRR